MGQGKLGGRNTHVPSTTPNYLPHKNQEQLHWDLVNFTCQVHSVKDT